MPSGPHAFDVSKPFKHSEISFTLMPNAPYLIIPDNFVYGKVWAMVNQYTICHCVIASTCKLQ
jgi:hypothetical protein